MLTLGVVISGLPARRSRRPPSCRLPKSRMRQPGPGAADDPVAVPLANRRSIQAWMKPQIVVSRRNQKAQAA